MTQPPESLLAQGLALHRQNRLAEAAALYTQALALAPDHPEGLCLLGLARLHAGRPDLALAPLQAAVERQPTVLAFQTLADAWRALGRNEGAMAALRQAALLAPEDAEIPFALGNLLRAAERFEEAAACFTRARALRPSWMEAAANLGGALRALGRDAEAVQAYRDALALAPDKADAWANLGAALLDLGETASALSHLNRAAELAPDKALPWFNLAGGLEQDGQAEAALDAYGRAIALAPEWTEPRINRALLLLTQGRLTEGWAGYAWRRPDIQNPALAPRLPQPWWQGEPLSGRRILLWREQGLGDQILFASMIGEVIAAARAVIVEVEPRLVALFARSFPQARIEAFAKTPAPALTAPDIDYQLPMGSLPGFLRPDLAHFPGDPSWLTADPEQVAHWRRWLESLPAGPKAGLCWRSGNLKGDRARKFVPLTRWAPLLKVPGIQWISLQYDECEAELARAEAELGVTVHRPPGLDLFNDLDGVAALMTALDRVVSAPTVVCEMAGALGRPTWRMCRRPHWSTLGTAHSPWMPALRCYTVSVMGSWEAIFDQAAADLARITAGDAP